MWYKRKVLLKYYGYIYEFVHNKINLIQDKMDLSYNIQVDRRLEDV